MNNGAFGENFPYSNFHDLNMDWIIKIAKDFLDQYTHIQETIQTGLDDLDAKKTELEGLLQEWYDTHSEDIAQQLASALEDINQALANTISDFDTHAEEKAEETIRSIPSDYTEMYNNYLNIVRSAEDDNYSWLAYTKGKYVYTNGNVLDNVHLMCSDFLEIPDDIESVTVYGLTTVTPDVFTTSPACVFYNENKEVVKFSSSTSTREEYITIPVGNNIKYVRFNLSMETADADKILFRFNKFSTNNSDFVGTYEFKLTSSARFQIEQDFKLKAGKTYKIISLNETPVRCRFFPDYSNAIYGDVDQFNNTTIIKADNDFFLRAYNVSNYTTLNIKVAVYEYGYHDLNTTEEVYYVSKQRTFQAHQVYTSLTQCLLDLKYNTNKKTIYVDGDDYDIFQEYQNAGVPVYTGNNPTYDFFDYCVWIPKNTHLIGLGNVRLVWNPAISDTTWQECQCVSPLNVAATATIENIEVYCKNGRYALHNDTLGSNEFIGAIQKFINVRFYKDAPEQDDSGIYGKNHTIGFGIDAMQRMEFINCEFHNTDPNGHAFYGHDRANTSGTPVDRATSGTIIVRDAVIDATNEICTRLDNSETNPDIYIRTTFAGCYFSGILSLPQPNAQNAFDISLIRCNDVTVRQANPRYPVKVY